MLAVKLTKHPASWSEQEVARFCELARGYIQILLDDLGLPLSMQVTTEGADRTWGFGAGDSMAEVNGRVCSAPARLRPGPDSSARALARAVAGIVEWNRDLLVTDELVDSFASKMPDTLEPAAGRALIRSLLETSVKRRINVKKVLDQQPEDQTSPRLSLAQSWFEHAGASAVAPRIVVNVGSEVLAAGASSEKGAEMFDMMGDGLFYELGIRVPAVQVVVTRSLRADEYSLRLNDLQVSPRRGLAENEVMVNKSPGELKGLGIAGVSMLNPVNARPCARVGLDYTDRCEAVGAIVWDCVGYLVLALSAEVRRNAGALISSRELGGQLEKLQQAFPALVLAARKKFTVPFLTALMRELLDEESSIRDLRGILEGLLAVRAVTRESIETGEAYMPGSDRVCTSCNASSVEDMQLADFEKCVRSSLARYLTHKATTDSPELLLHNASDDLVAQLRAREDGDWTFSEIQDLAKQARQLKDAADIKTAVALLVPSDCRKSLSRLLAKEETGVHVLSELELSRWKRTRVMGEYPNPHGRGSR